jgi:predicted NBD/HSP70 family sugar kinase
VERNLKSRNVSWHNAIMLTLGTGVGGAAIVNGQLLRGMAAPPDTLDTSR